MMRNALASRTVLAVVMTACNGSSHRVLPAPTSSAPAPSSSTVPSACSAIRGSAAARREIAETLQMVGGPDGALDERVAGTGTADASLGQRCTVTAGPDGRFTMDLAPGIYRITGHSPEYDGGSAPCSAGGPLALDRRPITTQEPSVVVAVVSVDCPRI
jgi:hypothetical protein